MLGRSAGGLPVTFDYGACSGPTGSGLPSFFTESSVQTVTLQPGHTIDAATSRSKSFPAAGTFAGLCIRVKAGSLDRLGAVNGVLTVF